MSQLVASIASSLSLLISLIGENVILDLDGHALDIEPLDHLLHLVVSLIDSSSRSEVEEQD